MGGVGGMEGMAGMPPGMEGMDGMPPGMPPLTPEMLEMAKKMEEFQKSDPEGFEAFMAASMAQAANPGASPEEAIGKLQEAMAKAMQADQAERVASDGIHLPGEKSMGLDGNIKDTEVGIIITPEPGFVIKTKRVDQDNGMKVFINICTHDAVAKPAPKKKLDAEGNEVEGLNVPISLGNPRPDKDHKGDTSVVYDCIVNPTVMVECKEDDTGTQQTFICQLAIQYVEQKYKCELDKKFKLPKMTYKGEDIQTQRVRDTSKQPTIQEVGSGSGASGKSKVGIKAGKGKGAAPSAAKGQVRPSEVEDVKPLAFKVFADHGDGVEVELEENGDSGFSEVAVTPSWIDVAAGDTAPSLPTCMILRAGPVHKKCVLDPTAIRLDVGPYSVKLNLVGHHPRDIVLPHPVLPDTAEASVDPHDAILELRIDVDHSPLSGHSPDPGSRPWLLQHALEGSDEGRGATAKEEEEAAPEDKYHLNKSAVSRDSIDLVNEEEELAEDRFHKDDALSMHYIQQREGDRKEKWDRHEREKKEREKEEKDDNVEHIDVEDFQPGGKYGPPAVDIAAKRDEVAGVSYTESEAMKKAASILTSVSTEGSGQTGAGGSGSAAGSSTAGTTSSAASLSSTVWAELLD